MASRKDWWALAVLVLPVLLVSIDMTVLSFALPFLSEDLAPSASEQLWIVDIYSFVLAGLLVLMGTVGDRIGRRKLLLMGVTAFGAASMLAAFSQNPETLIIARTLLGLGGATLMPSTLALVRSIFHDAQQRRIAIAIWSAGFSGGMALGPVLGGWLLEHFHWGSVFLVNVPFMLLILAAGPFLIPEARDPHPGRFDILSSILSFAAVLPAIYGIKKIATDGFGVEPAATIALGLAVGALFIRRQRKLTHPMLDLKLFANRQFSVSIATNVLTILSLIALFFLVPQYLQLVVGLNPLTAALWMLPSTAAGILGALLATQLTKYWSTPTLAGVGLFIGAIGFLGLTQLGVASNLALLVITFVLVGGGLSVTGTLTNDLIMSNVPPSRAGAAAAVSETGYEFGGALGTAVLGSVATAVYRAELPPDAPDVARETLAGAIATAHQLPAEAGGTLLLGAREAFTHGIQVVAWVSVAILIYGGIQAALLLRPRDTQKPQDDKQLEPTQAS